MNRLVFIVGQTASGKSTYFKLLQEKINQCQSKYGCCPYHNVIGYTSRPIRKNEQDGIDYFFRTKNFIETQCEIIRTYNNWMYGYKIEDIIPNNENRFVCSPELAQDIIEKYADKDFELRLLYLKVNKDEQLKRLQERKDNIEELKRRIDDDNKTFEQRIKKLEKTMLNYSKENVVEFYEVKYANNNLYRWMKYER